MLDVRGFLQIPLVFFGSFFLMLPLHYHQAVQQGAGGVIKSIVYFRNGGIVFLVKQSLIVHTLSKFHYPENHTSERFQVGTCQHN